MFLIRSLIHKLENSQSSCSSSESLSSSNVNENVGSTRIESKSADAWRATGVPTTSRRSEPTDWSALRRQGLDWQIPKFSGGPATTRDPRVDAAAIESRVAADSCCPSSVDSMIPPMELHTPRQLKLYLSLELPPSAVAECVNYDLEFLKGVEASWEQRILLRQMFRNFVIELVRGVYLTHLEPNNEYGTIHCQLSSTIDCLIVDVNTGARIEFPFSEIVKIYSVKRCVESPVCTRKIGINETKVPRLNFADLKLTDYMVVLEFQTRKIVFVFRDKNEAEQFKASMEILRIYNPQAKSFNRQTNRVSSNACRAPLHPGPFEQLRPNTPSCFLCADTTTAHSPSSVASTIPSYLDQALDNMFETPTQTSQSSFTTEGEDI